MSVVPDSNSDAGARKLAAEIEKLEAETRLLKRPWLDPKGALIPLLGAVIGLGSWYQANVTNKATEARASELEEKSEALAAKATDLEAKASALTQERDALLEERNKLLLIADKQRAELTSADAGDQSFAAAVQQVDAIRSSLRSIGEPGARSPAATLYVQVATEEQRREWAGQLETSKELGYTVPGIEVVGSRAPTSTEVRYFHASDRERAEQLVASLKVRTGTNAVAKFVRGYEGRTKPTTLELWIAR
jgi:cell division protein FtsB